jgi:hypothetical protein
LNHQVPPFVCVCIFLPSPFPSLSTHLGHQRTGLPDYAKKKKWISSGDSEEARRKIVKRRRKKKHTHTKRDSQWPEQCCPWQPSQSHSNRYETTTPFHSENEEEEDPNGYWDPSWLTGLQLSP